MSEKDKIFVVSGATGQQGGAVVRHLLAMGLHVRGLTRDPGKPAALALARQGADVVQGDLEDRGSLERALNGAYGVFSVQNYWLPGVGAEGEVRQGKALADAARDAGVQHFVYSSMGGANRPSDIPHSESKRQIEAHLRALALHVTIFRPTFFMDNYNWSRQQILSGTLPGMMVAPGQKLQMIAVDDIGAFVALAFASPQVFLDQAMELVGDELTESQIAETFTRVIGRPVRYLPQPAPWSQSKDQEGAKSTGWTRGEGYQAGIPALRKLHPGLMTLETWLRKTGWQNAQPEPSDAPQSDQWQSL